MSQLELLRKSIRKLGHPDKAKLALRFFKIGVGQYGEGDRFLGLTTPEARMVAKQFRDELTLAEATELLHSVWHEERIIALYILIHQYQKGDTAKQEKIYRLYLKNIAKYINNWDLVDTSAASIVGAWLVDKDRGELYRLAKSNNLWERRVAIIATFCFIKKGEAGDTLKIGEMLIGDTQDLMHKAAGWMLREVGKRVGRPAEEVWLRRFADRMPRTMLRYATEHFSEAERKWYLGMKGKKS